MGLNIKNQEAEAKIRELASLSGESLTEAITKAVDQRLEKIRLRQNNNTENAEELWQDIQQITKQFSEACPEKFDSASHADIYGEDGLPLE